MAQAPVPAEPGPSPDADRSGQMTLTQTKLSQTDRAYHRLRAMIVSGEVGPADRIDANRLVEALGFGRTPVREALLRLQTEGVVRIVPKRGVEVVTLSAEDLTEIYQVISAAEIEAVRLLAMTAPPAERLGSLFDAVDRMQAAVEADAREDWIQADEAFHRALLELNPNRRLRDLGLLHRDLAQRAHFVALRLLDRGELARSTRRHRKLIDRIVSGDAARAVDRHRLQRDRGARMLVATLRAFRLDRL